MIKIKAVILDLDGVITQTAKVHRAAWKQMFNDFLGKQSVEYVPSTDEDYLTYIDGKPRYEGVKSFLDSRKIDLTYGHPEDHPDENTVCGLGNMKNSIFLKLLEKDGVELYKESILKIKEWRNQGLKTAVVSSSKNCKQVLEAAGISDLFDVRIDGVVAGERGIKGKPEPDMFLEAAKYLGCEPDACVVFEDAISGVQAGCKGDFALVVGVSRSDNQTVLYENGADVVIKSFQEIQLLNNTELDPYFDPLLPSAFLDNSKFYEQIANKTIVLFFDYDGTLTPIVKKPEDAILSGEMKDVLKQCAEGFTVAVVSGRDMDNVKSLVDIDGIIYAGSHGFRISGPDGLYLEHENSLEMTPKFDHIENELNIALINSKGVQIERKRYAIAIHYRNAPEEDLPAITQKVESIIALHHGFKKGEGKKVLEIKPDIDWHKGKAIIWILEKLGFADNPDIIPIYIGDDVTDEDAFRSIKNSGIGILVGFHDQPTAAAFHLKSVYQVKLFLENLLKIKG